MSDYNVADKVEGEQWTPQEHNAMKVAVNSKMDKSNLVQDLSSPNGSQFPSTQAIVGALAGSFILRGNLTGNEQIKTDTSFQQSGYWIAIKEFNTGTTNAEYPVNISGVLRVYKNADNTLMEYVTIGANPRYFICSKIGNLAPTAWTEIATAYYLTQNHYCQCNPITSLPIINVIDAGTGGIYTADKVAGETWSKGVVRISSNKPLENGDVVSAEFSWADSVLQNKIIIIGNYQAKNCDLVITEQDNKVFTVSAFNFNSILDADVNEFYFTFLIQ